MYLYYALDYLISATDHLPLTGGTCQHAVCWLKRQFENKEENSHTTHWLMYSYNQSLKFNITMIVIHSSDAYTPIYHSLSNHPLGFPALYYFRHTTGHSSFCVPYSVNIKMARYQEISSSKASNTIASTTGLTN